MKVSHIAMGLCAAAAAFAAAPAFAQLPGKPASHPQASCIADMQRERATYQRNLDAGIKGGRIDPKEHAMLNKTHADLMAAEAKANADHKITPAECKALHARIMDENKKLQMALASPAGKGPVVGPKGPVHPQASCMADIQRERATYQRNLEAGIKGGKINPKEHAMLNKTHADLMAAEHKAMADHKISPAECKSLHTKIMDEHKKLSMAMASPAKK
jgi:hypothetical protein